MLSFKIDSQHTNSVMSNITPYNIFEDEQILLHLAAQSRNRGEFYIELQLLKQAINLNKGNPEILYKTMFSCIECCEYSEAKLYLEILFDLIKDGNQSVSLNGLVRAANFLGHNQIALDLLNHAPYRINEINKSLINRVKNALERQSRKPINLVSLGENCLPWIIPNRWGFRQPNIYDVQKMPFNLGQTSTDNCAKILHNAFSDFSSVEHLINFEYGEFGCTYPKNSLYSYDFNHNQGIYWKTNGFSALVKLLNIQVLNFSKYLDGAPRLFLHFSEFGNDFKALENALKKINNDNNYLLLILKKSDSDSVVEKYDNVRYLSIAFPALDYLWFRPDDFDSEAGFVFESKIVKFIDDAANEIIEH